MRGWNVSHSKQVEGLKLSASGLKICPDGFDTTQLTPECITQCACASSGCTYSECVLTTELPDGCCCPQHPTPGGWCGTGSSLTTGSSSETTQTERCYFTGDPLREEDLSLYRNTGRRGRSPMYGWRVNPSPDDAKYPIVPTLMSEGAECVRSCYRQIPRVGWGHLQSDGTNSLVSCIHACNNSSTDTAFQKMKDR